MCMYIQIKKQSNVDLYIYMYIYILICSSFPRDRACVCKGACPAPCDPLKTPQVVLPWEAPMEKELREAAREGKLMEVRRLLESKAWAEPLCS